MENTLEWNKNFVINLTRACGATIVNRTDEIREEDLGTGAGLFEIRKIGEEYYTYIEKCKNPKACTIILRGASKDVLNEIERNFQDAMNVARNVMLEPYLVPGGGAGEMEIAKWVVEEKRYFRLDSLRQRIWIELDIFILVFLN